MILTERGSCVSQNVILHISCACEDRGNALRNALEFAVEHRKALNLITGNQRMKLRQYELSEEDWNIATQLHDVLKVCHDLFTGCSTY